MFTASWRAPLAVAIVVVTHATPAAAQRRALGPVTAAGRDSAFRHQAIAILQGSDTLPFLSEGKVALVADALRSIHAQFPRIDGIEPEVDGTGMHISIADSAVATIVARSGARKPANADRDYWAATVTHTGIPALDRLDAAYGVRSITLFVSDFETSLYLDFVRPVNVPVLAAAYRRVPQVYYASVRDLARVYSWIALFDKGRTLDFAFARGGGDCPSGCTEWDYYYVAYDTVTRTAIMEREKAKDTRWSEPIFHWDVPSRLSINPYESFDALLAGTRDSRWWYRSHAVKVLGYLLGPAIGPWMGAGEQRPGQFTLLKRAALARSQESYGAIFDRLTDPDRDVARAALANLRSVSRQSFAADRAGLSQWRQWLRDLPNRRPSLEIRFLDVGTGDAILIREGPLAAFVDAGFPNDGIVTRLRSLGVDSLQLFVGNGDHDEDVGLAADVLFALPARHFVNLGRNVDSYAQRAFLEDLRRRGVLEQRPTRQVITLGDARIEIIAPHAGVGTARTVRSVIVRVERGRFRALLAGHADELETGALVKDEHLGHVDVLQAPFYGDTAKVTGTWLRRLKPSVVIVSSADASAIDSALRRYVVDDEHRSVWSPRGQGDIAVVVNADGSYSVQANSGMLR